MRYLAQRALHDQAERRGAGVAEYLKTPPTRERLVQLVRAMGIAPRERLRENGAPYDEPGLDDPKWTDDELIDFMIAHPILINRPIMATRRACASAGHRR